MLLAANANTSSTASCSVYSACHTFPVFDPSAKWALLASEALDVQL